MCLAALALMGGIILGESLYGLSVFLRFIPLFVATTAFVVLVCLKRTRRYAFVAVALIVGLLAICGASDIYDKNTISGTYEGEIVGRVSGEIDVEDGVSKFYIEDIYVGDTKLRYEAYVFVPTSLEPKFNAGDIVKIKGRLWHAEREKFHAFHSLDIVRYRAYTLYADSDADIEKVAEGELHLLERLPYKIKSNFYENLDYDTAAICTALVLGDKDGLDDELYDDISVSGLAHVLAVSGLHISILSSALFFVLRKCKVNAKISLALVFLFTLFYCFICNFTASSLRALVMMTVLNFSIAFGKKKDSLSTLSFSAILMLLFRPAALFEAGFLLSYSAVLGIILFNGKFCSAFMKAVNKASPKRHVGTHLAKAVALSLSANLVSYPFVAYFFGRVPVLFVISNIVVLPYLMFIYVFLLINVVFSVIFVWAGNLVIFKYLLFPFKAYVAAIGSLNFASVPVSIGVVSIIAFLFLCVFLSRFVFLERAKKAVGTLVVSALTVVFSLIVAYSGKSASTAENSVRAYSYAVVTNAEEGCASQSFDLY